jgi:hypothetical protein
LSIEELVALRAVMKRQSVDLTDEGKVLAEQIATRRLEQLRRKHATGN